jgi:tight adherence protein B
MARRLLATLALLVLLVPTAALASASPGGVTARMSSGAQLPFRAVVIGLPSRASLDSGSVHVFENGDPVSGLTVVPANATASGQFGVVLVIDASDSMRGDPVVQATAAARQFASQLPPNTKLAVVAFNSSPSVLLPFTTDATQISQALASPPILAHGTHIFDAVQTALGLISQAKIRSASIVVLSDGADTGSSAPESQVAANARKARIDVYAVGLRSRAFDAEALSGLAGDAGGTYSEASSPDALNSIYNRLGAQVANQYYVRYRTAQPSGTDVKVTVKVDGYGFATTSYKTPGAAAGTPYHHSALAEFWRSPIGMLTIVLLAAGLVGFAVATVIRPGASGVRARVGQFVSVDAPVVGGEGSGSSTLLSSRLAAGAERSFGTSGYWTRFKRDMDIAEMSVQPVQLLLAGSMGALAAGWLLATLTGFPILGLLGLFLLLIPNAVVQSKLRKKRAAFAEQLPDNLQVMASAMRAGHSFVGALAVVTEDSPEPSATEFRRAVADEQLGVSLEDALRSVVERMDNRDLSQVALVAALQRETGGNTAEVLERVTETIRERFQLRRLVKTLTAQGRMSRWIVSALPVLLLLIISALNPKYEEPLFSHPAGRILLVLAAALIIGGSLVIKRIVNIKV